MQKIKYVKIGPSKRIMLWSPCMVDGSIGSVHRPFVLVSTMYLEAGSQLPWEANRKSGYDPCIYGEKQRDQIVL